MAENKIITINYPKEIFVSSKFKISIKAIRYMTYDEVKTKTYNDIKQYTYNELKGE